STTNAPAPTATYTLSLHDALPIFQQVLGEDHLAEDIGVQVHGGLEGQQLGVELGLLAGYPADAHAGGDYLGEGAHGGALLAQERDRKSTRLNSSHVSISYAVFCLK